MPRDKLPSIQEQRTVPDTYSALLNEPAQGHALWDPRQAVDGGGALGDIGIISNGVFHKQWNVYNKLPDGVPLLRKQPYRVGDRYYTDILESGNGAKITFYGTLSANPVAAALAVPLPLSSVSVTPKFSNQHENYAYLAPIQPACIDEESYEQVKNLSHWFYANIRHFHKGSVLVTAAVRAPGWLSGISIAKSLSRGLEAGANVSFFDASIGGSKEANKWNAIHKRSSGGASDYTLIIRYIVTLSRTERIAYKIRSTFNPPPMPALADLRDTIATSNEAWNGADGHRIELSGKLSDGGVPQLSPLALGVEHLAEDGEGDDRSSTGRGQDDSVPHATDSDTTASDTRSSVSDDDIHIGITHVDVGVDLNADAHDARIVGSDLGEEQDGWDHTLLHDVLAGTLDDPENQDVNVVVGDWSIITDYHKNYRTMLTSDMTNVSADVSRPRDPHGKTAEPVAFVTALASDDPCQLRLYYASASLDITSEIWFTPWVTQRPTARLADIFIGTRISSAWGLLRYAASVVSFGTVEAGEQVAVKIPKIGSEALANGERRNTIRRIRREISIWRRLKHRNVQPFYGVWWPQHDPLPAVVSPWRSNGNLKMYLRQLSLRLSEAELAKRELDLLEGVLLGLMYLHDQNVIHADLKPEKVLISSDGNPLLFGFGTAWTSTKVSVTFTLNRDASAESVAYMAPELLDERYAGDISQYSHKSDIWAYGCLFFRVTSGIEPYSNKARFISVIGALQKREFFPRPAGFKNSYWALVRSCCSFDIEERVPTSFIRDILRRLRGEVIPSNDAAERTFQKYLLEASAASDL